MLGPGEFRDLVEAIAMHSSVTTLRIHTRLPVMRPDVAMQHFELLRELPARFECVLVSHVDHPDELDEQSQMVFGLMKTLTMFIVVPFFISLSLNPFGL